MTAPPEGCGPATVDPIVIHGTAVPIAQCAEGLRTWNQTVPGVFDGGWAFGPEIDCDDVTPGIASDCGTFTNTGLAADGITPAQYLKPATYIVAGGHPAGRPDPQGRGPQRGLRSHADPGHPAAPLRWR